RGDRWRDRVTRRVRRLIEKLADLVTEEVMVTHGGPADLEAGLFLLCHRQGLDPRRGRGTGGWKRLRRELLAFGLAEADLGSRTTFERRVLEYLSRLDAGEVGKGRWRVRDVALGARRRLRLGALRRFASFLRQMTRQLL